MVRIIVIFAIIISGILFSNDHKIRNYQKRRQFYITSIVILLILQSGLRNWAVGPDTFEYHLLFESVKSETWQSIYDALIRYEGKDPFYKLFQKTFQLLTGNFQLYLMLVAVIFMSAFGNFIYKNTSKIRHAIIAFVIYMGYYYGFFSITGIRQTLATAFLLLSFEYIKKRNLLIFTILVFVAFLFHSSALVFLPLYFIAPIKRPRLIFMLALLGFPLFMIFKNELAVFFVNSTGMEDRFGNYAEQYYRGGSFIITTFHVLLSIFALIFVDKVLAIAPRTYRMYNTFALALFFLPLQWVNPSAGRISQYFAVIMMVWIPYLLDTVSIGDTKNRRFYYAIAIVMFVFITTFAINASPEAEYKFYWQEMKLPKGY